MNKCFITKLPSSVDNDNLPVLGQLRINWLKNSNLTNNNARTISLVTKDSITVKVSGAHFTDSTLTSNLGNTKTITADDFNVSLYVSNDSDAVLTIDNKYSLGSLSFGNGMGASIDFDIDDIKYCTNLSSLILTKTQVNGDISALSKLTNLINLYADDTNISGDISALSKLTNLIGIVLNYTNISGDINALTNCVNVTRIGFNNTNVNGDISVLSKLTNLNNLSLNNTNVSGDINALSKLTNLNNLELNNTNVSGAVDSLANLTKLPSLIGLKGISLTGDMSKIPANVRFISQIGRKVNTNFTWTANGRKNATFLGMDGGVPFDTASMDNMFIDQATCAVNPSGASYEKVIGVRGTRTSASDAAVATIQNMGITISGVSKVS